jgi:2-oxoglutarate dehydrogenase E2 component (dihydrolipoamide succinyltransferase)
VEEAPGDWVEADETICEVSTDKIDTEVPSPAAGRVTEIAGRGGHDGRRWARCSPRIATDAKPGEAHADEHIEPQAAPSRSPTATGRPLARYSPVVQRIAAEHDVDLDKVEGPAAAGGCASRTCWRTSSAVLRSRRQAAPLHIESPYRPDRNRRLRPLRGRRDALADAPVDRRAT